METINTVELRDEGLYPGEKVLRGVLGGSYDAYSLLLELFAKNELTHEWRYYRDGKAWLCKVQKKKRTIIRMSAWKGHMQAMMYFPEKHAAKVYELDIGEEAKNKIRGTNDVGKSKPYIFEVRNTKVLGTMKDFTRLIFRPHHAGSGYISRTCLMIGRIAKKIPTGAG